eukprot:6552174-Alexandrium_andersonii.AAC.1
MTALHLRWDWYVSRVPSEIHVFQGTAFLGHTSVSASRMRCVIMALCVSGSVSQGTSGTEASTASIDASMAM